MLNEFFNGAVPGDDSYQIPRSLRFNPDDTAYLSRTFPAAGNQIKWTFSGWVKRGNLGTTQTIFGGPPSQNYALLYFKTDNTLEFASYVPRFEWTTTAVYRDTGAWMHILLVYDTTQSYRMLLYVNGVQQGFSGQVIGVNTSTVINGNTEHQFGRFGYNNIGHLFDGYMAESYFLDGVAADPTDFGEFDNNGVWQPIEYTGTYGTNGFYLDFSDNSTAAALGADTSGNSNTWTVNNISVTAGAGNDSFVDYPTNGGQTDTGVGGEVVGNYATLNPVSGVNTSYLTNGNLTAINTGSSWARLFPTIMPNTGKWYIECLLSNYLYGNRKLNVGIAPIDNINVTTPDNPGILTDELAYDVQERRTIISNQASQTGFSTYVSGDIIGVAIDFDNRDVQFYLNNAALGTAEAFPSTTKDYTFIIGQDGTNAEILVNFGQRPFAYTAPSGYKALCTANLPDPTIADGSTAMEVVTYAGNGSTQTISGLDFSPDLVWIKQRTASPGATSNILQDTVRGLNKTLFSDGTNSETTNNYLTSFNSDGFGVDGTTFYTTNGSGATYAAWTWDAGSSTVTNTDGSITSSVRANPSAGFSIVTFNSGSAGQKTVGHGLNAAPAFVISKTRDQAGTNWAVYHESLGKDSFVNLNSTGAASSNTSIWGVSSPTSSVIGLNSGTTTGASGDCVFYCFAPVDGYSFFSSYTGNGDPDGPFVWTGFRPRWIMIKRTDNFSEWMLYDTERSEYNGISKKLYANQSLVENGTTGETDTTNLLDHLSAGFKLLSSNTNSNASGGTYIYAAFAEHPFKYARAR